MGNPILIASAAVFVVLALLAARIAKRALAALTKEEKVTLVDVAAKTPASFFLLYCVLLATWFGILSLAREYATIATCVTLGLVIALSGVSAIASWRVYKEAGLPAAFLKDFVIARSLRFIGALIPFSVLLWVLFGAGSTY